MNFEQVVRGRHSSVNFDTNFKMTESDFKNIIELTKLAPSPFNLQPTRYLIITDEKLKEKLYNLSFQQYKIKSSSAAILVLADTNSLEPKYVDELVEPMRMLKILDEEDYKTMMFQIDTFRNSLNSEPHKLILELQVVAAISSVYFTLSAESLGFNTCTMHVQNIKEVKKVFNIPENLEPYLMITMGKSTAKQRPRGNRRTFDEMVKFDTY